MQEKEGAFMTENKLLDLSFEFAVAIVKLVDGVTAPDKTVTFVSKLRFFIAKILRTDY